MVTYPSNAGRKISILTLTAVLLLGSTAALSWNNPASDNQEFGTNNIELNVTEDTADYVQFWYRSGDDSYKSIDNETSASSGDFYTHLTESKISDGTFDFKANNSQGEETRTSIVLDTQEPQLDSNSPSGSITDTSPTVEASVSDKGDAGVNYTFLNVTDSGGNDVGETKGTSIDFSDLSDDTYTVDYKIFDKVGNWKNDSWTFTVDTEYKGDESPDFEESGAVRMEDGSYDLEVELDEDEEDSSITVTCYDGDDEEIDSDTEDVDGDTTFTCEVDDDYSDTEQEVYLEMCDEAGNCKDTEDEKETFIFDSSNPDLEDIGGGFSVVNGDFDLDFSASDVSGVEKLEYFFDDENTDEGSGNQVDLSGGEDEFSVEMDNVDPGKHTLYTRVKDGAGRWSEVSSFDIDYRPDAEPQVSIGTPGKVTVKAGESESFSVSVTNDGELFIPSIWLTASDGGAVNASRKLVDLYPGNSSTATFTASPDSSSLGKRKITVSTDRPAKTQKFDLIIRANEDQKEDLESEYSSYRSVFQDLKSNITELKKKVSGSKEERLESNFSRLQQQVKEVESAVESNEYYRAQPTLSEMDDYIKSARQSYDEVKKEHRESLFWRNIFIGFGGLTALVAAAGVFFWRSDEYGIELDQLAETDIPAVDLEDLQSRLQELVGGIEEAEEEVGWDGFTD